MYLPRLRTTSRQSFPPPVTTWSCSSRLVWRSASSCTHTHPRRSCRCGCRSASGCSCSCCLHSPSFPSSSTSSFARPLSSLSSSSSVSILNPSPKNHIHPPNKKNKENKKFQSKPPLPSKQREANFGNQRALPVCLPKEGTVSHCLQAISVSILNSGIQPNCSNEKGGRENVGGGRE